MTHCRFMNFDVRISPQTKTRSAIINIQGDDPRALVSVEIDVVELETLKRAIQNTVEALTN